MRIVAVVVLLSGLDLRTLSLSEGSLLLKTTTRPSGQQRKALRACAVLCVCVCSVRTHTHLSSLSRSLTFQRQPAYVPFPPPPPLATQLCGECGWRLWETRRVLHTCICLCTYIHKRARTPRERHGEREKEGEKGRQGWQRSSVPSFTPS